MKKFIAIVFLILCIGGIVSFGVFNNQTNSEILRIHIRANSNDDIDQNVKYLVKDAIVSAMLPIISDCETKEQAENCLQQNFEMLENVANQVLAKNGFSYTAKAKLAWEEFPARVYSNITYDAGFYDALIIELGQAKGDNWWCVVYPPLCFLQTNNPNEVKYTSKLVELIKKITNK